MAVQVSGSWKRSRQPEFYDVPGGEHVADKRHTYYGHDADPGQYSYTAPPSPAETPAGLEDFGSKEVTDTGGVLYDQTPVDHSIGYDWGVETASIYDLDQPGGLDHDILIQTHATHNVNLGGPRRSTEHYARPLMPTEKYEMFRIPGYGPEFFDDIPALAGGGGRGLNSYSVNNPPLSMYDGQGWRRGTTEIWNGGQTRKFQARIIQRQGVRPVSPNVTYVEPDAPPPTPGNPLTSPFSQLQRVISSVAKTALQRRTPPLPGDILAEEATPDPSGDPESVIDNSTMSWVVQ
jgi:hypothetical protein